MIFDVFTLVFKSNAKEIVQGNKEAAKSTRDLEKDLKNSGEEAEKLANNYSKIVETATKAAAAFVSFGAIKSGILNAAKFNSELEIQSKILNQNADEMIAYGAAVEAAGGSVGAFQQMLKSSFEAAADAGMKLGTVEEYFSRIRESIKGLSKEEQNYRLRQLGISDMGIISLLQMTDTEYKKAIDTAKKTAVASQASREAAREFQRELSATGQSLQSFWSGINEFVLPVLTGTMKAARGITEEFTKDKASGVLAFATAMTAIGSASLLATGRVLGLTGAIGGALGVMAKMTASLSVLLGAGLYGWELGKGILGAVDPTKREGILHRGSRKVAGWLNKDVRSWGEEPKSGSMKNTNADAYSFFKSKGYSDEEIAAIMANIQAESGGRPGVRGDGGNAHGLAQWHKPRRDAILKGTGIDVSTASYAEQLQAIAWEMKNEPGFDDEKFRNLEGAGAKAAYFSKNFERPRDKDLQAMIRAQMALDNMANFPMASGGGMSGSTDNRSSTVKIDSITVNSQATDAGGIANDIGSELQRVLGFASGNLDDGVAM